MYDNFYSICLQEENLRAIYVPSDINLSLISQAKIVGFSLLYCSIFDTTAGVATFGLLPPINPGGLKVPAIKTFLKFQTKKTNYIKSENRYVPNILFKPSIY